MNKPVADQDLGFDEQLKKRAPKYVAKTYVT